MAETSAPVIKREINAAVLWLIPAPGFFFKPCWLCLWPLQLETSSCILNAEFLKRTHNFCNVAPRNQFSFPNLADDRVGKASSEIPFLLHTKERIYLM